jgi:hypothetical protein
VHAVRESLAAGPATGAVIHVAARLPLTRWLLRGAFVAMVIGGALAFAMRTSRKD